MRALTPTPPLNPPQFPLVTLTSRVNPIMISPCVEDTRADHRTLNTARPVRNLLAPQAPDESMSEYNRQLDSDAEYIWMPGNEQGMSESEIKHKCQVKHLMKSYYNFSQSSLPLQQMEQNPQQRDMSRISGISGSGGGEDQSEIDGNHNPPLPQ